MPIALKTPVLWRRCSTKVILLTFFVTLCWISATFRLTLHRHANSISNEVQSTSTDNFSASTSALIISGTGANALVDNVMVTTAARKRLLTTQTQIGRLGNKLFQYASLCGIAMRYGFEAVMRDDEAILNYLDRSLFCARIIPAAEWTAMKWKVWWEPSASSYDQSALETGLQGDANVHLERFLQSFRYFRGFESSVIRQIRFKQNVYDWSLISLLNLTLRLPHKSQNATFIGVHVRRGDYLHDNAVRDGYNTPGEQYYVNAVQYFASRFPYSVFIVCSNDITWSRKLFTDMLTSPGFNSTVVFEFVQGTESAPEKDLVLLSQTNHTILSAGSYSFWAAMLREYRTGVSDNGTTVYYNKPFKPGTRISQSYGNTIEHYYPPEWLGFD